jgi:hypothetical protein
MITDCGNAMELIALRWKWQRLDPQWRVWKTRKCPDEQEYEKDHHYQEQPEAFSRKH